ncbi:unnamed protein product [Caenorhabditis nigoni]
MYAEFISILSDLITLHTPSVAPSSPKNLPTPNPVRKLRRVRYKLAIALKTNASPASQLVSNLRQRINSLSRHIKRSNTLKEKRLLETPHSNRARNLISKRIKATTTIPPLKNGSLLATSNPDKASLFAETFRSNFPAQLSISPSKSLNSTRSAWPLHLADEYFPPWIVERTLEKLPSKCGFFTHPANYFFIKRCATSFALPLSIIFTRSLVTSSVPLSWKHSYVIPVHKKGNPCSPDNYRPISLTDPFARIFERIICTRIRIDLGHRFSPFQFGFLSRRSCTNALIYSTSQYKSILKEHKTLDVVFFDFKKAFDMVPHNLLLRKLNAFGIPPILVSWLGDYLSNRTFSVKVDSYIDPSFFPVPSGVPQGSVVGPLLFIIFINDLLESIPSDLHFSAFADDIKLYSHDPVLLQSGINTIDTWATNNKLPLAHTKTSLLRLGSRNMHAPLFISSSAIVSSDNIRDLGLITDSKLKFTQHINKSVAVSLLRSKQLLKSFKSTNPSFYLHLFRTYVLPSLEYCSVVYSPSPNSILSHKLESPLRFFTRKVFQKCNISYSSYQDRLSQLDLFSIRHRRLKSKLMLLYKMISDASYMPELSSFIRISNCPRRPMTLILSEKCNDDFFFSTAPIWNAIVRNTPQFLTPGQFSTLIQSSITRF